MALVIWSHFIYFFSSGSGSSRERAAFPQLDPSPGTDKHIQSAGADICDSTNLSWRPRGRLFAGNSHHHLRHEETEATGDNDTQAQKHRWRGENAPRFRWRHIDVALHQQRFGTYPRVTTHWWWLRQSSSTLAWHVEIEPNLFYRKTWFLRKLPTK